ncbi:MAG: hypothetical protein IKQ27_12760 [Lachnospiraceae bacterium]|nr:hypothetical protein [Oscillospiraceae bacterium]MBR6157824.1 hypothetical protein [Lachnospiraceae bacterium]
MKGTENMYVFIGFTLILVVIGLFTIVHVSGRSDDAERMYWNGKKMKGMTHDGCQ